MKLLRPLLLSLFALGLLASPAIAKKGAPAGDSFEPTADQKAVHSLQKQIAAAELAQVLALSAEQAATLRELVARVVAEKEARRTAKSDDAPELRALLEDYLAEVKKNGAPSQGTAESLAAFKAAKDAEHEAKAEAMGDLHEQLRALLDEDQKQALMAFEPSVRLGPGPEGRQERRMEQRERRSDRGGREARRERGVEGDGEARRMRGHEGGDFEPSPEMMERRERRMQHQKVRRLVRHLLLSQEMIDALD